MSRVAVIGTGYVGLTTGSCLAHLGHEVTCVDVDERKVATLSSGQLPIVEEGLFELLHEGISSGRLSFTVSHEHAVQDAEVVFLCVPTPEWEDGSADLTYVKSASKQIATLLRPGAVVVNKSTVPVGSTVVVQEALGRTDVSVVSNPEFLREGTAVKDFLHPDRVVIGADDRDAAAKVAELYAPLQSRMIITDPASAETIKYAANAFLATKISFINALAAICERVGADIEEVALGIGSDRRIGEHFLKPGPGWGGSCFPKDTKALVKIAEDAGYSFDLLKGVIEVNKQQHRRMVGKIRDLAGGDLKDKTVAVWGLTFKAATDDMRDSPAIEIVRQLLEFGVKVIAFDPTVVGPPANLDTVHVVDEPVKAVEGADVLVVLTEWPEFAAVSPELVAGQMSERRILDTRNILNRRAWEIAGFEFRGVGR